MSYRHVPHYNFVIGVLHADGGSSYEVILESNRKVAIARAMRGLTGAKVIYCKTEDELSNSDKGYFGLPSYVAPPQRSTDYSVLDMY